MIVARFEILAATTVFAPCFSYNNIPVTHATQAHTVPRILTALDLHSQFGLSALLRPLTFLVPCTLN